MLVCKGGTLRYGMKLRKFAIRGFLNRVEPRFQNVSVIWQRRFLFVQKREQVLREIDGEERGEHVFFKMLKEDIDTVFDQDPAARSYLEVVLTYSGLHAIWAHRVAHAFYKRKLYFLARIISQVSRFFTGVEIHPAATIGRRFFIDHGMGVVIGETCEIGDNVTVFQGVTLGGTGKEKGKRHPTILDDALIATGAKVLGSITVGKGSKIGAGSVVLKDVPDHSTVVGIPGRVVVQNGKKINRDLNHQDLPDPVSDRFKELEREMEKLKRELASLSRKEEQS
ncbi:Serine acetyltransferase [Bacillus altitudinis]|nr:Serine acetyltransferase [Bacillus altitudinis]MDH8712288.1 serine O-acetyltransferase [Micromonospora sp. 1209]